MVISMSTVIITFISVIFSPHNKSARRLNRHDHHPLINWVRAGELLRPVSPAAPQPQRPEHLLIRTIWSLTTTTICPRSKNNNQFPYPCQLITKRPLIPQLMMMWSPHCHHQRLTKTFWWRIIEDSLLSPSTRSLAVDRVIQCHP